MNIAQIMKHVVSSAADAEIGALFINARQAIPARMAAEELGHPQPPTPVQTDNTTALGFANKNLQPKVTKSTDMKNWWIRDREAQEQFRFYWAPGLNNDADYFTKHFCEAHHREKRPRFLTPKEIVNELRKSLGQAPHEY